MEPPTFEPAKQPLRAFAGLTFATVIRLWQDEAHTVPFSLKGYTVKLEIDGIKTLVVGEGLEVEEDGEIRAQLTATETLAAANNANTTTRYRLLLEKAGTVACPMHGAFTVEQP